MNISFKMIRLVSVLVLLGVTIVYGSAKSDDPFANRVNLALRQTGHQLLLLQCDSTSTIAPVEQDGAYGFLLPLQKTFDYHKLPDILDQAFRDYEITEPYELVVMDTQTGIVLLGYNRAAFDRYMVPCMERTQFTGKANIFVQFDSKHLTEASSLATFPWLFIPFLAILLFWLFRKKEISEMPTVSNEKSIPSNYLPLGQYHFDPQNQLLINGSKKTTLTFRENKLLHFLATQPNQVLARADILSAVWEDEGVIVGRSLDVFISRLRKLLHQDGNIQIKSVHGVGYRLELLKYNLENY